MGEPEMAWAFVSGGKDSVANALHLSELGKLAGIVTFDTGIRVPEAIEFVSSFAGRLNVPFESYATPVRFGDLVRKYHFPSPATHYIFVSALKGRCVRQFHKAHPEAWGASGVRQKESRRRMFNTQEFGKWEGVPMWAPIYDWSDKQVWEYLAKKGESPSPASRILGISGDCLCGAYSRREEVFLMKGAYPVQSEEIAELERQTGETWGRWSEGLSTNQTRIDDAGELWGCAGACAAHEEVTPRGGA
jgi:3'-phosphoadenosine 5'-phosphosulfate sulfotransferase (PAPS reductase)/FAD synthetase